MSSNLDYLLVIGTGFGFVTFFKGFRIYREYRVLEDTPEMPIRSIAMGLVHVHGKAIGDQRVNSPVSNTPCFFYKVDIEQYRRNQKGEGSWSHYATDANGVNFYLQDASGKVLMDAHKAEYDLIQASKRETASGTGGGMRRLLWSQGDPTPATGVGVSDTALVSYAESLRSSSGPSVMGTLGQLALGGRLSLGGGISLGGSSTGRYRFKEYCILPGHWYDVTGTCVENPAPKDEHDRNMIQKGQNEPTFLISWRAEKEIEKTLRNRAALYVFGGGALSIVCLGILLKDLGWL